MAEIVGAGVMESFFDDERGVITEFWIECIECGLRVNILETELDCGCEARLWHVLPELTRRLPLWDCA
jgi:hypothetical protein